jgi:DNA polymerase III gamma/tau subunit
MKHLSRNFRLATLIACTLMSASGANETTGGTAPVDTSAADAAKAEAKALAAQQKADKKAAADKAKAEKAEAAEKAKAEKAEADKVAKAEAETKRKQETEQKKLDAAKAKEDKKAAAEKAKADKAQAAADAKAAKEANKQPEQNGVRRPKPDGACGKAWAHMDELTLARGGSTVPIAALLEATNAAGLNEGNVRAEYARWRKFNGVTGRIVDPKPAAPEAAATNGDTSGTVASA